MRARSLSSWLIRVATWSEWSHCAIVTPNETVIESRALMGGVVEQPLADSLAHASEHRIVEVSTPDDAAGVAWARAQIGAPYDWTGVLGIALRRRWADPDSWFCSELVEAALAAAGRLRFRDVPRVTPQHSWMAL